ncbi:hypothetical protein LHJ74_12570 [Streptomyces sp. N2-109]|uniref:Integral membrane protein n=1 Tax=Streptomyces gossypii TaxID=2883101 RepID=A0ABT2JSP5_9ACTN|nr:hypothetical protein [Streptomyces gossypii]MCT2590733.1 hypothetical protein [Streptomyces gossypii]
MAASPSPPFNRRVRVLVEVVDDDDEEALARELLGAEGWLVRDASASEADPIGERRRGFVVEVRMQGARRGARRAAEKRVARVAERAKLALWVRQALVLEPPHQRRTAYEVRLSPPDEGRFLARWTLRAARWLGGAQGQRSITRPGTPDKQAARSELANSPLKGSRPFNQEAEFLHGPADVADDEPDTSQDTRPETAGADGFLALCLSIAAFVGTFMVGLACGGVFHQWDSPWRWALLAPTALLSGPMGSVFGAYATRRSARLAAGAGGAAASFAFGYMLLSASPVDDGDVLVFLPLSFLGGGIAVWMLFGIWQAIAHSWFSRNAHWLVPALVVPVPLVLMWFGKVLFAVYLDYVFGIPAGAVPLPQWSLFLVTLRPVGVATGCALFFLAVAGWARYTYLSGPGDRMPSLFLPLLTLLYVITALSFGLLAVGEAAYDTAEAVQQGKQPAAYFGLDPALMCVRPLGDELSVYNGPLSTDRPVLTFGSAGDRVWLWGPQESSGAEDRWAASSVRLEDVSLTAPKHDGGC